MKKEEVQKTTAERIQELEWRIAYLEIRDDNNELQKAVDFFKKRSKDLEDEVERLTRKV